jgi:hypothetical protein
LALQPSKSLRQDEIESTAKLAAKCVTHIQVCPKWQQVRRSQMSHPKV